MIKWGYIIEKIWSWDFFFIKTLFSKIKTSPSCSLTPSSLYLQVIFFVCWLKQCHILYIRIALHLLGRQGSSCGPLASISWFVVTVISHNAQLHKYILKMILLTLRRYILSKDNHEYYFITEFTKKLVWNSEMCRDQH